MKKLLTWNEFQTACKETWAITSGASSNRPTTITEIVGSCLIRCHKTVGKTTKADVAAVAYELYKSENTTAL